MSYFLKEREGLSQLRTDEPTIVEGHPVMWTNCEVWPLKDESGREYLSIVESSRVRIRMDRPKDIEIPEPARDVGHRVIRAFQQSVTVIDRQSGSRKKIIFRPEPTSR